MIKTENESLKDVRQQDFPFFDSTRGRESVVLRDLPIGPSSNNQYLLLRRGKKTYHVPSKELTLFKKAMEYYAIKFPTNYLHSKTLIDEWVGANKLLEIYCVFYFKREKLFSKKNEPKKLDVSNRLKASHDSLSKMFGIDDKLFFRVFAEKCVCPDGMEEMMCVEIIPLR